MAARATLVVLAVLASVSVKLTTSRQLYVEKQNFVSWYQAHVECLKRGFKGLATASSAEQEKELLQAIGNEGTYFWIGLTDLGKPGKFVWFNTGQRAAYANWAPGEPSNANGNEDCVAIMRLDKWYWNDDVCAQAKAKYVCEK